MQDTGAILGGLGVLAFVALFALAILTILVPVMIYTGQKWAYRCYQELTKTNATLKALLAESEAQRAAFLQVVTAERRPVSTSGDQ